MICTDRLPAVDPDFDPARATVAGALAAFGYLGVMYADIAISGSPSDDLLMLGRALTAGRRRALLLGLLAHTGFGTAMGLLYGGMVRRRLRGAGWSRGMQMLLIENTLLWPLTFLADRFHPSMRSGELPRMNTPVPIAQQIVRHIAFGGLMGLLYGKGKDRSRRS